MKKLLGCTLEYAKRLPKIISVPEIIFYFYFYNKIQVVMIMSLPVTIFSKKILRDKIERFGSYFLTCSIHEIENVLFLKHISSMADVQNFEPGLFPLSGKSITS